MAKAMFGVKSPEWWKHLKYNKAVFWGRVRNQPLVEEETVRHQKKRNTKFCKINKGDHKYTETERRDSFFKELMITSKCACGKEKVEFRDKDMVDVA